MYLFLILSLVIFVQGGEFSSEWKQWKESHGKEYSSNEIESLRFKIFEENRRMIQKHNEEESEGLHTFTMGMNQFGDLLHSEFIEKYIGASGKTPPENIFEFDANTPVPPAVNWTAKGAVTPVKNQGDCLSYWAFSATGAIESQLFIHNKKLLSLSEQQLIDCSRAFGNDGCNGGLMDSAFKYIMANKGIASEDKYPYRAKNKDCVYNKTMSVASISYFKGVQRRDEDQLKIAVSTAGPVSVSIDSSSGKFRFYKSGVFYDKHCSSQFLNNGVLIVGYGVDKSTKKDYWLVKNSWGPAWGLNGYIMMARNMQNMCGIATAAVYPVL